MPKNVLLEYNGKRYGDIDGFPLVFSWCPFRGFTYHSDGFGIQPRISRSMKHLNITSVSQKIYYKAKRDTAFRFPSLRVNQLRTNPFGKFIGIFSIEQGFCFDFYVRDRTVGYLHWGYCFCICLLRRFFIFFLLYQINVIKRCFLIKNNINRFYIFR